MLSDRRLLTQAVTNLVKNASEAIDTAMEAEPDRADKGHVIAKVRTKGDRLQITVIDNGCGLPKENRQRLVEPYMTTRAKGTGLGLAIVQRITEQHGGTLAACRCAEAERQGAGSVGAHGPAHPRDGRGACGGDSGWERRPATSNSPRGGRVEEGAIHGV